MYIRDASRVGAGTPKPAFALPYNTFSACSLCPSANRILNSPFTDRVGLDTCEQLTPT